MKFWHKNHKYHKYHIYHKYHKYHKYHMIWYLSSKWYLYQRWLIPVRGEAATRRLRVCMCVSMNVNVYVWTIITSAVATRLTVNHGGFTTGFLSDTGWTTLVKTVQPTGFQFCNRFDTYFPFNRLVHDKPPTLVTTNIMNLSTLFFVIESTSGRLVHIATLALIIYQITCDKAWEFCWPQVEICTFREFVLCAVCAFQSQSAPQSYGRPFPKLLCLDAFGATGMITRIGSSCCSYYFLVQFKFAICISSIHVLLSQFSEITSVFWTNPLEL